MNISKHTWLVVIPLTLFIQACAGPEYKTFYNYDPPKTSEGRACIFQCENTKMQCEQLDQMRVDNCQGRAELKSQRCADRAQADYDRCEDSGRKFCIKDDCEEDPCYRSGQCDNQYQRCYSNCGGQVTSETRCVANCDKK